MSLVIGFDFETHLMGPELLAPPPVCLSGWCDDTAALYGKQEERELNEFLDVLFDEGNTDIIRVAHDLSFDLGVTAAYRPDLIPAIFSLLADGLLTCTKVREKMLNLTDHGYIDAIESENGVNVKVSYTLAGLLQHHFGIDISASKTEDSWRMNYAELEDLPLAEWPEEAREYAIDDSLYATMLYARQEERRQTIIEEVGVDPFETLNFQVMSDFCLHLMSCRGIAVDAKEKAKIEEMLEQELSPENLQHLISSGILRPGSPSRPYANGAKNEDGSPKMTKPVKESVDSTKLKALVERVCRAQNIEVKRTDPSDRFPEGQVSTSMEVIEDLCHFDPAIDEYRHRQKLQKLVTTELPRMTWEGQTAAVAHPAYDSTKVTGRTSSFATSIAPSFNCQNVDPRVRACFVPRPGYVLFSCDYNQMELGTLAQTCYDLFGASVLRDKINEGKDLHSYLGAQIARHTDEGFSDIASANKDECYEQFYDILHGKWEDCPWVDLETFKSPKAWAKHYRTLAKPTGLGYPGGLGPETFVRYAKATYHIIIDINTATLLRDIWKQTFEEMPDYFDYINKQCVDPRHSDISNGQYYHYTTPFGMYRPNCNYCAAANGMGLQSPSAEGAKLGMINTVRACYDPSVASILYGHVHPICFIHDEILGEVREDDQMHGRVMEICDIMVEAMRHVTPDVTPRVSPALMRRWDKAAEAVYDGDGRLTVWEPSE